MSIWTTIRNKVISPLVNLGATYVGTALGGPAGGAIAGGVMGSLGGGGGPTTTAPITTAGSAAGGLTQTLPVLYQGGTTPPGAVPGGTPPTMLTQLAAAAGGMTRNYLTGTVTGGAGVRKMHRGKLTGNAIPAGYVEKMSPAGVIYLGKRSRRRGISARDLSSFRRVERLVRRYSRPHTTHRKGK